MFAFFYGCTIIFSRDLYLFIQKEVWEVIQAYANARKRTHYSLTILIFSVEAALIFSVHEPLIHLLMSGGVTSWEALVIKIGEESL